MAHLRQQIREAVATALTGLATTGTNVHQSRMKPSDRLPCLLIETNGEKIEQAMGSSQMRTLDVIVRGMAKVAANVDDTLDTIAKEVEVAVEIAGTFGGKLPGGLALQSIDVEFDELEKPVGMIVMSFSGLYFTNAGAPETVV